MYAQDEFIRKVHDAKFHDAKAMEEIIDSFALMVKKYSYWLNDEDGRQEFILTLIEVVQTIPLRMFSGYDRITYSNILAYIEQSMKNKLSALRKRQSRRQAHETDEYDDEFDYGLHGDFSSSLILRDRLRTAMNKLTRQQQEVVWLRFLGYNDVEIGKRLGISRQAVNRVKNRAADTIRARLPDLFDR